jgi:hypothetical protein
VRSPDEPLTDAAWQRALDQLQADYSGPYGTPEGVVSVPPPFKMTNMFPNQRALVERSRAELQSVLKNVPVKLQAPGSNLTNGRATPAQLTRVTQTLIDTGHLPLGPAPPRAMQDRIRLMMFEFGLGVDCAGYVQQAYLRATGLTARGAGFRAAGNEDLSSLEERGFTRVRSLAEVRPGDIVSLGPPALGEAGHRVIVYEQHVASDAERTAEVAAGRLSESFVRAGPVRAFQVDSSWGANIGNAGTPYAGGVERRTWWRNEATGQWAWTNGGQRVSVGPEPYDHPLIGVFRGPHARAAAPQPSAP